MKTNKGYTLIEMIIVIAIMAILTGVAFVTIGIVKEARCDAAVTSFESQLDSLWIKTKAISQGSEQASPTNASDPQSKYPLAMLIRKNEDEDDDVRDGSYELVLGFDNGATFDDKEVVAVLTDIISIKYTPKDGQSHALLTKNGDGEFYDSIFIQFNKSSGAVEYGAGTYEFVYNGRTVGSIYLDPVTGNHYTK